MLSAFGSSAQNDSTAGKLKRMHYGLEIGTELIPKVQNVKWVIWSKPTIGWNSTMSLNYNINKNWSLSCGIGVNMGYHELKRDILVDINDTEYVDGKGIDKLNYLTYKIPLLIQYQSNKQAHFKYIIKAGIEGITKKVYKGSSIYYAVDRPLIYSYKFKDDIAPNWKNPLQNRSRSVSVVTSIGLWVPIQYNKKITICMDYKMGPKFIYMRKTSSSPSRYYLSGIYLGVNLGIII